MTRFCSVFNFVLAFVVALQVSSLRADDAVPVLLWGDSTNFDSATSAVNPFLKTSREEFEGFLHKKLESSPSVLLFVLDNLCVEDLVKHKQQFHEAIGSESLHYFPAVDKAVEVFQDLLSYNQSYATTTESASEKQLIILPINNLDSILETYKASKKANPNLIGSLAGKSCSYRHSERVKRELASDNSTFVVKSSRVLLYSSQPLSLKISDTDTIQLPLKPTFDETGKGTKEHPLKLTLQFTGTDMKIVKHKLSFVFEVKSAGYYTLKTIPYEFVESNSNNLLNLTTKTDIVFPFNFSYHCSHNIVFEQNSTTLTIADLQVQIDPKVSGQKVAFSDAYDCVGFTTIPIWTGIFVTAILALIMIWALTMIMDIRTMDRFDDPKGKTITVSAVQE